MLCTSFGVRACRFFFGFADPPLCVRPRRSTPVGLQYERFYIPDAVRILDAIVETLAY